MPETLIPLACPVPGCGYVPPSHLSDSGKERALGRHVELTHSLSDLPSVTDALKAGAADSVTVSPETPSEPQGPVKEPEPTPAAKPQGVAAQTRPVKVADKGKGVAPVIPIGSGDDVKKQRIEERAQRWGQYLYNDFNPMLVTGTSQFIGVPEPWLKGGPGVSEDNQPCPVQIPMPDGKTVTFWDPTLEKQLSLSKQECNRIAKAGATFAESPMGMALDAWLQHNAHYVALAAALWAAGSYGWRVMRIRTEVAQLKELIEQQSKMSQQGLGGMAGQQPMPGSANNPGEEAA